MPLTYELPEDVYKFFAKKLQKEEDILVVEKYGYAREYYDPDSIAVLVCPNIYPHGYFIFENGKIRAIEIWYSGCSYLYIDRMEWKDVSEDVRKRLLRLIRLARRILRKKELLSF